MQVADEFVRIIPEKDGGDAFLARSDQDCPQRALSDRELDFLVRSAGSVLGRSHAQHIRRFLVETSAGIEARVVNPFGDGVAGSQSLPDLRRAVGGGVVLGRQAGRGFEHAMEIARAATDRLRQLRQQRFFVALLDYPARLRDEGRVPGIDRRPIRIAPFAGPEAGSLGALQGVVELNIFGVGRTRGARRPTIDASGGN